MRLDHLLSKEHLPPTPFRGGWQGPVSSSVRLGAGARGWNINTAPGAARTGQYSPASVGLGTPVRVAGLVPGALLGPEGPDTPLLGAFVVPVVGGRLLGAASGVHIDQVAWFSRPLVSGAPGVGVVSVVA